MSDVNIDELSARVDKLYEIVDKLQSIESKFAAFNIDKQNLAKSSKIKPGIGTKISYNADGVILSSEPLSQDDIPQLDLGKINNLENLINEKATMKYVNDVEEEFINFHKVKSIASTGTKVNVDEHGHVVSVSDLVAEDIPQIPVSKVTGLEELLSLSNNNTNANLVIEHKDPIKPGTGCKITYDENGRVVLSDKLSIDDLPNELIDRIDRIDSTIATMATKESLQTVENSLKNKMDVTTVESGTYTKVTVNKNGIVVKGDAVAMDDLPSKLLDEIHTLSETLKHKVDTSSLVEINNSLERIRLIAESQLKPEDLDSKANVNDLHALQLHLNSLENKFNNIIEKIPGDEILTEIYNVKADVDTINGRLAVIETMLKINEGD